MTQSSLRFVSWNTNGIKKKIPGLLKSLSNLHADVAFIQETHVGKDCYETLFPIPGWRSYFTVHSSRSKGVAILIRGGVTFEYICCDEDYSGCYIVLFCKLYGELYTLVNVYNHKAERNMLGRLEEYLRETAEGMLVIGGDFNTVFHPCFDRRSTSEAKCPPRCSDFLEDFTVSLNLRDIWSYKRPTDEGFTRHQNDSYSRLDMFFLPDHKMGRVANINVAHKEAELQGFSDHYPLILELTVQHRPKTIFQKVASALPEPCSYIPDRRPGKISAAEILSAIKSLTDVGEHSLDNNVNHYEKHLCQQFETLKTEYNTLIKNRDGDICTLNVTYLIFSRILAKRLSESISPSFKRKIETNLDPYFTVTFETGPQKIKWSFLESKLKNFSDLTVELNMLDYLLSKEQDSSELRLLKLGCPLTKFILSLALNELEGIVVTNDCKATVCHQRQVLRIHTKSVTPEFVDVFVIFFKEISGLTIRMLK